MFSKYAKLFFTLLLTVQLFAQNQTTALQNKIQQHRNSPDSLVVYAKQLYDQAVKTKDTRASLNALMALGSSEMRRGNLLESNRYYHQLIKIADSSNRSSFGYGAMSNLAMNHRRLQRNDSAFYYFKKVNAFYSDNDFKMPASQAKMNLGISYFQYQELDSAYHYLRLSLKGFKGLDNKRFIAQNQSLLAEVYYQKQNYTKAIELADSSLVVSKAIGFKPNLGRNYSLLSRSFEKLGDSAKAAEFTLLEEQNLVKRPEKPGVGRLNEKYEMEMQKRRLNTIEKVDSDKKFYKSNFFIITIICVFLLGISIVMLRKNRLTKMEVSELQALVNKYVMAKANKTQLNTQNTIVLKSNVVLNTDDILYIKSDGHYTDYFIQDKANPEVDRNSLAKALADLPKESFIRTHRSYIVNVQHIKIINSTQLMLDNGEWIPLSRTFKPGLKDLLNKK